MIRRVIVYLRDEVFAFVTHGDLVSLWVWEVDGLLPDELVHLQVVIAASVEGREADDHFVGQDAESPPVDGEAVTLLIEDLGSQVLGSAAEGVGLGVVLEDLGEAEVSETDVAVFVHEDVLWLQVSVDDVLLVQMPDGQSHLGRVELGSVLVKPRAISQMHKQLTSPHEPHHKEYLLVRLEHVVHSHQEGMVGLQQYLLLQLGALHLVVVYDHILTQRLHCIHLLRSLLFHEENLPKATSTYNLPNDEILESNCLVTLLGEDSLGGFSECLSVHFGIELIVR
jgi:hypothetical protein